MTLFQTIAALLVMVAIGSYLNHKYAKLPSSIGQIGFALLVSLLLTIAGKMGLVDLAFFRDFVANINFSDTLLHGMLSFLLFAGALHIDVDALKNLKWPIGILATLGVVIATFITGTLFWYGAHALGVDMPYLYALLFGALISPTDPIAVLSILKEAGASKNIYIKIGGESLFNDGVGVVIFLTILGLATSNMPFNAWDAVLLLGKEALGGLAFGTITGWVTYRLLRTVDEYKVEALMTLALAAGGYVLAEILHVSAPIAMVAAGLMIGHHGRQSGMSPKTRHHLDNFWELIDEVLNAILFMLVGINVMIISMPIHAVILGFLAVGTVLLGRYISVAIPVSLMRIFIPFEKGTIRLLTWGGLRGGLSVAMALSLPMGEAKDIILPVTYVVVLFSIFVQGLTFRPLLSRLS